MIETDGGGGQIFGQSFGMHGFRNHGGATANPPSQQYLGWRDLPFRSDRHHHRVLEHHRRPGVITGPERGVGGELDAGGVAVAEQIVLLQQGVALYLQYLRLDPG